MSNQPVQPTSNDRRPTVWEWIVIVMLPVALCGIVATQTVSRWRDLTPQWIVWLVLLVAVVANWYLTVFAIWHWRTRYAGKRPFAWAVFFVYGQFVLPSVFYFFEHILPDIRRRADYAPSVTAPIQPPPPPTREMVKSFCFVVGWVLIFWATVAAVANMTVFAVLYPYVADCVAANVPKEFSPRIANAILWGINLYTFTVGFLGFCCVAASIGGVLLYASRRAEITTTEETPTPAVADVRRRVDDPLLVRIEQRLQKPAFVVWFLAVVAFLFVTVLAIMLPLSDRFLKKYDADEAAGKFAPETKKVVVALGALEAGSILGTNNMAMKSFETNDLPDGFIFAEQWKFIAGRRIHKRVEQEKPILLQDIFPAKE